MPGKSYGQFCGLARALDVVGDRWSLLIVRELSIKPARFGELRAGLPAIATNLLTERLKTLEQHGVLQRALARDSNAVVYVLTAWGEQLHEPVSALIRWSTPLMAAGRGSDSFDPRWLVPALSALLADRRSATPVSLVLVVDDTPIGITISDEQPSIDILDAAPRDTPDLLHTSAETALALAAKAPSAEAAVGAGLDYAGDPETLRAVFGAAIPVRKARTGRRQARPR